MRAHARNEFEPKVEGLLSNTTTSYLTSNRGPFTTTNRSKKKYGTVLDRLFDEYAVNIDVDLDYDDDDKGNYSESDDEVTANLYEVFGNAMTLQ